MFKKLLAALSAKPAAAPHAAATPVLTPYAEPAINSIYAMLFCDDRNLFATRAGLSPTPWQTVLMAEPADRSALAALTADVAQEGRVRYLAFARLRELGEAVEPKILLGTIVEVPLPGGLDVLAGYADGSARYINQSGKLLVLEQVEQVMPQIERVLAASRMIVERIGPWEQPRLPPPALNNVRMSFLVSDGLYFGEGPMSVMQSDPMAGPLIHAATALLQAAVELGTTKAG